MQRLLTGKAKTLYNFSATRAELPKVRRISDVDSVDKGEDVV